jgi:hypothetical protein
MLHCRELPVAINMLSSIAVNLLHYCWDNLYRRRLWYFPYLVIRDVNILWPIACEPCDCTLWLVCTRDYPELVSEPVLNLRVLVSSYLSSSLPSVVAAYLLIVCGASWRRTSSSSVISVSKQLVPLFDQKSIWGFFLALITAPRFSRFTHRDSGRPMLSSFAWTAGRSFR